MATFPTIKLGERNASGQTIWSNISLIVGYRGRKKIDPIPDLTAAPSKDTPRNRALDFGAAIAAREGLAVRYVGRLIRLA